MKWPRSLSEFASEARESPLVLLAGMVLAFAAVASVALTCLTMYWDHVERESRHRWIENTFERHVHTNNRLIAHVEEMLATQAKTDGQLDNTLDEVRRALEANREETKEFRRAVLEWMKQEKIIQ